MRQNPAETLRRVLPKVRVSWCEMSFEFAIFFFHCQEKTSELLMADLLYLNHGVEEVLWYTFCIVMKIFREISWWKWRNPDLSWNKDFFSHFLSRDILIKLAFQYLRKILVLQNHSYHLKFFYLLLIVLQISSIFLPFASLHPLPLPPSSHIIICVCGLFVYAYMLLG